MCCGLTHVTEIWLSLVASEVSSWTSSGPVDKNGQNRNYNSFECKWPKKYGVTYFHSMNFTIFIYSASILVYFDKKVSTLGKKELKMCLTFWRSRDGRCHHSTITGWIFSPQVYTVHAKLLWNKEGKLLPLIIDAL